MAPMADHSDQRRDQAVLDRGRAGSSFAKRAKRVFMGCSNLILWQSWRSATARVCRSVERTIAILPSVSACLELVGDVGEDGAQFVPIVVMAADGDDRDQRRDQAYSIAVAPDSSFTSERKGCSWGAPI